ncbi:porin [Ferruginibacter sp. SUN002]|uniref:porin n=1 Tax=Ferruginibacter sp. SUN002 TaxID=2937789 RepID=UPI003D36E12D
MSKKISFLLLFTVVCSYCNAQFLMDMIDTTTEKGKGMLAIYKKFDHLRIGGYIQPQFQVASSKGEKSFAGGDFAAQVSNRFMLRRSRIRIDYAHFENGSRPGVQIVFQFDANERTFTVRDIWGRVFENNLKLFSFTTGMFARPFGFETNLSSSDRESPERGRMNQILMKSERDLGAMVSFDVRRKKHALKNLKIDIGVFNGQGINATGEFDNTKDIISRISLKPVHLSKAVMFSAGTSFLSGGLQNNTKYINTTETVAGIKKVVTDSAVTNIGTVSARQYFGADLQLKYKNKRGLISELRAEFIVGKQTGTLNNSETPTALLSGIDGFHVRNFNGAYFYFLQNIFSAQHQLLVKYDWYDPNSKVEKNEIGAIGTNFTAANIKYTTLGFGYINYLTDNAKLILYYDRVWNEKTALHGFTSDVKDNVFTCRLQFRF